MFTTAVTITGDMAQFRQSLNGVTEASHLGVSLDSAYQMVISSPFSTASMLEILLRTIPLDRPREGNVTTSSSSSSMVDYSVEAPSIKLVSPLPSPSRPQQSSIAYNMRNAVEDAVNAARVDMLELLVRYGARGWKGMLLKEGFNKQYGSCWPNASAPLDARVATIRFCIERLHTPIDHVHTHDMRMTTLCQRLNEGITIVTLLLQLRASPCVIARHRAQSGWWGGDLQYIRHPTDGADDGTKGLSYNDPGRTTLQIALMNCKSDDDDLFAIVRTLVDAGVDINHIGNRHSRTALTLSHIRADDMITRYLIMNGADVGMAVQYFHLVDPLPMLQRPWPGTDRDEDELSQYDSGLLGIEKRRFADNDVWRRRRAQCAVLASELIGLYASTIDDLTRALEPQLYYITPVIKIVLSYVTSSYTPVACASYLADPYIPPGVTNRLQLPALPTSGECTPAMSTLPSAPNHWSLRYYSQTHDSIRSVSAIDRNTFGLDEVRVSLPPHMFTNIGGFRLTTGLVDEDDY